MPKRPAVSVDPPTPKRLTPLTAVIRTQEEVELKLWLKEELARGQREGRYPLDWDQSRLVMHWIAEQKKIRDATDAKKSSKK